MRVCSALAQGANGGRGKGRIRSMLAKTGWPYRLARAVGPETTMKKIPRNTLFEVKRRHWQCKCDGFEQSQLPPP